MPTSQIAPGDMVLCHHRGKLFHATVQGRTVGGLRVAPVERGVTARVVKLAEVREHWARQPRPNAPADPAQATLDHLLDR